MPMLSSLRSEYVLVHIATGRRLCHDGRWRDHAAIGDYPSCLKFYKRKSAAITKAGKYRNAAVAAIPDESEITADGRVYPPHTNQTYRMQHLVVWQKGQEVADVDLGGAAT